MMVEMAGLSSTACQQCGDGSEIGKMEDGKDGWMLGADGWPYV